MASPRRHGSHSKARKPSWQMMTRLDIFGLKPYADSVKVVTQADLDGASQEWSCELSSRERMGEAMISPPYWESQGEIIS
jgi:hypothetical protein